MYQILARFKKNTRKPVIVHASEVCASGGYYIACAGDQIVVQPTTVIGSIGVIFETFDATGTMSKIGLKSEAIKSARNKDMGSPLKPLGAEEREIMQGMVNEYFDRFTAVVREHRNIRDSDFATVTDGRVFSGQRAVELGLADHTGLLEDAIGLARRTSGHPKARVVTYKRPYAYGGSIYASAEVPQPKSNVLQLELPGQRNLLPTGFYYLWNP
jgi:protease-4